MYADMSLATAVRIFTKRPNIVFRSFKFAYQEMFKRSGTSKDIAYSLLLKTKQEKDVYREIQKDQTFCLKSKLQMFDKQCLIIRPGLKRIPLETGILI